GDLHLFDRDGAFLGVEGRGLEFDRQAVIEPVTYRTLAGGIRHDNLRTGEQSTLFALGGPARHGSGEPLPQILIPRHAALQRQIAVTYGTDQIDLPGVVAPFADLLRLDSHLQAITLRESTVT